MLLLFKLALRNLIRNRIRTLLNLLMVVGAFTSVVIFKSFSGDIVGRMEQFTTNGQFGHLQLATPEMWDGNLPKNKKDAYLEAESDLKKKLRALPSVRAVGDRANAYVLLSNGTHSIGAEAVGFDPVKEPQILKAVRVAEGQGFSANPEFEILIGAGIQKQLNLKIGQSVTLVSQSLSGSVSSIEPEVRGVFTTTLADLDNSLVYVPLKAVQKLLGTDRVERHVISLKSSADLEDTQKEIGALLKSHPNVIVKTWKELAAFYHQVKLFYGIQNLLIEIILGVLIFLGILNTVGMSIYERIGEIGTMRALGDQQSEIMGLFLLESLLLGFIGAALGCLVAFIVTTFITSLKLEVVLPGQSYPDIITLVPSVFDYLEASFMVILTCLISCLWPSLKAIRLSITDALRANS